MGKIKQRNSSIEVLRILAMLGIVMLHYNDGRAFVYAQNNATKILILYLFESVAICSVDLFVIISGFFLSSTNKRNLLKPFELLIQVSVFSIGFYSVRVITGRDVFSGISFFKAFVPNSYFVIFYVILYVISPYINRLMQSMDQRQNQRFVSIITLIFSIWAIIVDLTEEILGFEWFGLSPITAWGSKQGFNIVNFVLLYCIGAYLRYYGLPQFKKNNKIKLILFWGIDIILIFVWALISRNAAHTEMTSAWVYHNPLVILSAVLLLTVFADNKNFSNKIINSLSSASFTVFLVHTLVMDHVGIQKAVSLGTIIMLLHIIAVLIVIYLISWVIHVCYHKAIDWVFIAIKERLHDKVFIQIEDE